MNKDDAWQEVTKLVENYVQLVRVELRARWEKWKLDLENKEMYEAIGALLARQVTLSTQMALSPGIWNGHIAPVLLRSMTDAHITLAWILKEPLERSRQFIVFGLGQEKLLVEHRKTQLEADGLDPENDPLVKASEAWLNSQLFTFLTEVNVGNWAGKDVRTMAEEADCKSLYNFAYSPFSSVAHNMWSHISRYNLVECPNPLHRYHKTPIDPPTSPDIDYLYRAAKYVQKSFKLFDEKFNIEPGVPSGFDFLVETLERFGREAKEAEKQSIVAPADTVQDTENPIPEQN